MQAIKCVVVGDSAVGKTSLILRYATNSFPGEYIPIIYEPIELTVVLHSQVQSRVRQLLCSCGRHQLKHFTHSAVVGSTLDMVEIGCDTVSCSWIVQSWELGVWRRSLCVVIVIILVHWFLIKRFDDQAVDLKTECRAVKMHLWDIIGEEYVDELRHTAYSGADVFLVCFSVTNPTSFLNVKDKWLQDIHHHCPDTPFILVGTKLDLRGDTDMLKQHNLSTTDYHVADSFARQKDAANYIECSALSQNGINVVFDEALRAVLNRKQFRSQRKRHLLFQNTKHTV